MAVISRRPVPGHQATFPIRVTSNLKLQERKTLDLTTSDMEEYFSVHIREQYYKSSIFFYLLHCQQSNSKTYQIGWKSCQWLKQAATAGFEII